MAEIQKKIPRPSSWVLASDTWDWYSTQQTTCSWLSALHFREVKELEEKYGEALLDADRAFMEGRHHVVDSPVAHRICVSDCIP